MADDLSRVFDDLKAEAVSRGVDLDSSFFVELQNYSRHVHVDRLEEEQLLLVIYELGKAALEAASDKAGGGTVRLTINEICCDPFSDCYNAAMNILAR